MARLSVIIPSRTEPFLNNTIRDVLKNAVGDIEVIPVLDGYEPDELVDDPRVRYIRLPEMPGMHKRIALNEAVTVSTAEHIMCLDAHCMVSEGFDEVLVRDCKDNWVMIPRRHRLDAENWCIQPHDGRPPIDYEYWMWQNFKKGHLHGYKWNQRTIDRMDIPIDETLVFQGSAFFMHKDWFYTIGPLRTEGFGGFIQDPEEVANFTRMNGGKVMTNKNAYTAHLHKGKTYGRMYPWDGSEARAGNAYSYDLFVNKRRKEFVELIDRFFPIPNWPSDWKERIFG